MTLYFIDNMYEFSYNFYRMNFLEKYVFYYCCVGKCKMHTYYKISKRLFRDYIIVLM